MSLGEMCLCVCDGVSESMQNWKIEREVASVEVKSLWKSRITDKTRVCLKRSGRFLQSGA